MRVLVTGGAGFIGAHVARALQERGDEVAVFDDFSETIYPAALKEDRLQALLPDIRFIRGSVCDRNVLAKALDGVQPDHILHFAAIAGIRYAAKDPFAVIRANIEGTLAVFEEARKAGIQRVIFASSSSVYGRNEKIPFAEDDPVVKPVSLYAATKLENELLAEVYRANYGMKMTGIRFFTVYGPWGRPDMAYYKFTKAICEVTTLELYAQGKAARDFTSIHDIVRGVLAVIDQSEVDCKILNLGNSHPVTNGELVGMLEEIIGKKAVVHELPLPKEDAPITFADISRAKELYGWEPKIKLEDGLQEFVEWYVS
ncbi:MAG: NAD-dependent epimerase/dehydratase family protein [Patescibacteria group bacterium]